MAPKDAQGDFKAKHDLAATVAALRVSRRTLSRWKALITAAGESSSLRPSPVRR